MNDLEKNRHATFTRVRDFGVLFPNLFPAALLAGELMAIISAMAEELNSHTATHAASTHQAAQGSTSKAAARSALREDIEAINRTARAMAVQMTGLDDKFRIPPHKSDADLLTAARAFVIDATPLKNDFIRYGLPDDFLEDLHDDIAAFEQATTARNQSVESQTASTAAIDVAVDRGMKALKQLDAIMRNVLRDDIARLTAWITASHVERVPRRRKQPQSPPAPPNPAQ